MYLSYHLDISSGATIVLVNFAVFAIVYLLTALGQTIHAATRQQELASAPKPIELAETAPQLAAPRLKVSRTRATQRRGSSARNDSATLKR